MLECLDTNKLKITAQHIHGNTIVSHRSKRFYKRTGYTRLPEMCSGQVSVLELYIFHSKNIF